MYARCTIRILQSSFSIPFSTPFSHCSNCFSLKLSKRFLVSPMVGCGITTLSMSVALNWPMRSIKIGECVCHQIRSLSLASLASLTLVRQFIKSDVCFMWFLNASSWESGKGILARFSGKEENRREGATRLLCDMDGSTSILLVLVQVEESRAQPQPWRRGNHMTPYQN